MSEANTIQIGGSHYKGVDIQHWDLITNNYGPSYLLGCATKYLSRHRKKNGAQDLEKAAHYLMKLSECDVAKLRELTAPMPDDFANFTRGMETADRAVLSMIFTCRFPEDYQRAADEVSALKVYLYE